MRAVAAGVALGEHAQQRLVVSLIQVGIGLGAADQRQQRLLVPFLAGHFGDDLLGQHVQRRARDMQQVQLAKPYRIEQCGAFDQLVPGGGKDASAGYPAHLVTGAADALQEGADGARRTDLADPLHITDVDAQLQRGGRHQHAQLARLQPPLGLQALFPGQAAVVRGHRRLAEALGQVPGHPLGQPPGVDEHQRGAPLARQLGEPVVDQFPGLVAHHRLERHRRHFQGQVQGAAVADVDNRTVLPAGKEARHRRQRLLRRGQADAHQRLGAQRLQAFQAQRQMAAALVARHRVDLVDDHAARAGEHVSPR